MLMTTLSQAYTPAGTAASRPRTSRPHPLTASLRRLACGLCGQADPCLHQSTGLSREGKTAAQGVSQLWCMACLWMHHPTEHCVGCLVELVEYPVGEGLCVTRQELDRLGELALLIDAGAPSPSLSSSDGGLRIRRHVPLDDPSLCWVAGSPVARAALPSLRGTHHPPIAVSEQA